MTTEQQTEKNNKNENISFVHKVKRKQHPNEYKYPGFVCQEVSNEFLQLMGSIPPDDVDKLVDGKLIIDEEKTAQFFDSLVPGDVIGCCCREPRKFNKAVDDMIAAKWKINKIENDILYCDKYLNKMDEKDPLIDKTKDVRIAFEDVSVSLAMNLAEVLIHDNKFYGCSEEEEVKVNILNAKEKK